MTHTRESGGRRRRAPAEVQERVVEAARRCFRRNGITATKMYEIADEAGLLRPNLYRYFPSKEALLVEVNVREMRQINDVRRAAIPMTGPVGPLLVRSVVMGSQLAREDEFVKFNMSEDAIAITARLLTTEPRILDVQYEYWGPLLEYGRARHEIRPNLTNERIVRWILSIQLLFFQRPEFFTDLDDVRQYVEDFVVPPILA